MATKVICDACGEKAEHSVSVNPMAFPELMPRQQYDEDGDLMGPQFYFDWSQYSFDCCGKEECFRGSSAEQKLRMDNQVEKIRKGLGQ